MPEPLCTIAVFREADHYRMEMTDAHGQVIAGAKALTRITLTRAIEDALMDWVLLPAEAVAP